MKVLMNTLLILICIFINNFSFSLEEFKSEDSLHKLSNVKTSKIYYKEEVLKKYLEDIIQTLNNRNIPSDLIRLIYKISTEEFNKNCIKLINFSKSGKLQELQELLKTAAFDINATDEQGNSALILTTNIEIMKLLILHGADVNIQTQLHGSTPLMHAADNADVEMVRLLINNNAAVDTTDSKGMTALMHAVIASNFNLSMFREYKEIISLLIMQGNANLDIKDKNGYTAMMYTTIETDEEIVKLLLAKQVRSIF